MAWAFGNNPAGRYRTDIGEILCEIAHRTNEVEHMMGRTETEWLGGLGSYPGVHDLDGINPATVRTLIAEIRGVIDTDLLQYTASGSTVYACDASWNVYTWPALYLAAMGAGATWETATANLAGHNPIDARLYEEMMKCLELLVRWVTQSYETKHHTIEKVCAPPGYATTGAIFTAAVLNGITTVAATERVHSVVEYDGGSDTYCLYRGRCLTCKSHFLGPSTNPFPSSKTFRILYSVEDPDPGNSIDLNWYLRTISAAEWAAPAWASTGTQRDNRIFRVAETDVLEYVDPAWVTTGEFNYFRMDNHWINPFVADPNATKRTFRFGRPPGPALQLRFANTVWTYG